MAGKKYKAAYGVGQQVQEDQDTARMQMERLIQESLCSNCRHQGDCSFLPKACAPIQNCELHECGVSEKPSLRVMKRSCAPVDEQPEWGDSLLGLCIDCSNLKGCQWPKPEGGVWMCEEYS